MALTPSAMLPLGTPLPRFTLLDVVSANQVSESDHKGQKGLVVVFICVHCPYVIHIQQEMARIAKEYQKKGVGFIAISSNDVKAYPQDAPEFMKKQAEEIGFSFPYLYDESQQVAKEFTAACTPDIFVFDHQALCTYRGRLDDSTPGNGKPLTGKDLRAALDSLIIGRPIPRDQYPSMGCNIKWKSV